MDNVNPIASLIARWPSRREFALEVGASIDAVHKWAQAGRIPSGKQLAVQSAATKRGMVDITPEWMLAIHSDDVIEKGAA